jgi:3-phosphoshikimate 1-carboxyvinyltransferase
MAETRGLVAGRGGPLTGAVAAPGDKSISHRALILAALAEGRSTISGLLEGEDILRTAAALRALGAQIEKERAPSGAETMARWRVEGGALNEPEAALYFGNSGTGCRLVMGAVAGLGVGAVFRGDASLNRRPMERVLAPLRLMGARAESRDGMLPVRIARDARLAGVDYALPKPSAQVKSAILLAALGARGRTIVREAAPSRDHTERMSPAFGAKVSVETDGAGGRRIQLDGPQKLKGADIIVPGDPSSAAFLVAAALIVPGSDVLVRNVCINPLRTGFFQTVREMGADIRFEEERVVSGEPVADIRARASKLKGVAVPAARAASMIDEYPALSILAAIAEGKTRMEGISELRVKESDRIAAVEAGLNANGVRTNSGPDWLEVEGVARLKGGGRVATRMDHRIAMSFLVMGLAADAPIEVDEASIIATSFPGFADAMRRLGAQINPAPD